jgi:hypothetical protein
MTTRNSDVYEKISDGIVQNKDTQGFTKYVIQRQMITKMEKMEKRITELEEQFRVFQDQLGTR